MTAEVEDADWVLLICSPQYREKVKALQSGWKPTGSGWELSLITSAILDGEGPRVALALGRGHRKGAIPFGYRGRVCHDLTAEATLEKNYRSLLQELLVANEKAPPLGPPPVDLQDPEVEPVRAPAPAIAVSPEAPSKPLGPVADDRHDLQPLASASQRDRSRQLQLKKRASRPSWRWAVWSITGAIAAAAANLFIWIPEMRQAAFPPEPDFQFLVEEERLVILPNRPLRFYESVQLQNHVWIRVGDRVERIEADGEPRVWSLTWDSPVFDDIPRPGDTVAYLDYQPLPSDKSRGWPISLLLSDSPAGIITSLNDEPAPDSERSEHQADRSITTPPAIARNPSKIQDASQDINLNQQRARPLIGSCADPNYALTVRGGNVDDTRNPRVLTSNTQIYSEPEMRTPIGTLEFDEAVRPVRVVAAREALVEVQRFGESKSRGWVQAADLLCNTKAIKSPGTGLDRMLFIRSEQAEPIEAYRSPDSKDCTGGCEALDSLEGYFIHSEDEVNNRYLISGHFSTASGRPLLGWVDRTRGFEWNTSIGLRPSEEVTSVYGFQSLQDAVAAKNGGEKKADVILSGGPIWHSFSIHIPLLNTVYRHEDFGNEFYHFIAPNLDVADLSELTEEAIGRPSQIEAFSPINDDWIEEVWISRREIDRWINILQPLIEDTEMLTDYQKRNRFVDTLIRRLESDLGPPSVDETAETIGEFLARQGGLPGRSDSPLLQYSMTELRSIENCELNMLIDWVDSVRQLLNHVIATPHLKPGFRYVNYPESLCPTITAKGRKIRRIVLDQPPTPLGSDPETGALYSYSHSFRGDRKYWLPRSFLP